MSKEMNEESIREPKLRTINFEAFVRSQEKECLRRELKKETNKEIEVI